MFPSKVFGLTIENVGDTTACPPSYLTGSVFFLMLTVAWFILLWLLWPRKKLREYFSKYKILWSPVLSIVYWLAGMSIIIMVLPFLLSKS